MSDRVKNPAIDHVMDTAARETVASFRKIVEAVVPLDASVVTDADKETALLGETAYLIMQAVPQAMLMAVASPEQIMFRLGEGLGNILRPQTPDFRKHMVAAFLLGIEDGLAHEPADPMASH